MDSELRRRFLQNLGQDFAARELQEEGVINPTTGRKGWGLEGQRRWPEVRAWWLAPAPSEPREEK